MGRNKIGEALKNRIFSKNTKDLISQNKKGFKYSERIQEKNE